MAERDFAEIARLSEKYSKDPKSRIFVQLADAYRKNGMTDEALDVLKNGLQHHPDYALGYLILGKCYGDQRKYEQAKDAFVTTLKYDPQNIVAMRMIAQICETLKDEKGQVEAYRGILTLDPFDASAKEKLGRLEAMQPKEPLYTISVAQEYEKQGDLARALEVYERLSFTDPSDLLLKEKVSAIRLKLSADARHVEQKKIEELQVETFFRPEDVDLTPPEISEPVTGNVETIQADELIETTPSAPSADSVSEFIEMKEIGAETDAPKDSAPQPGKDALDADQSLDIMQPVENQPMEETIQNLDIINPTDEATIGPQMPAAVEPEEIIEDGDLLEPVIESEDRGPVETPQAVTGMEMDSRPEEKPPAVEEVEEKSIPVTAKPAEKTPVAEPISIDQPVEITPVDQKPPQQHIASETAEQTHDAPAETPPSEIPVVETADDKSVVKPTEPEKPVEPQEKEGPASKPKEEDFKSFQDWLSGLLK